MSFAATAATAAEANDAVFADANTPPAPPPNPLSASLLLPPQRSVDSAPRAEVESVWEISPLKLVAHWQPKGAVIAITCWITMRFKFMLRILLRLESYSTKDSGE